jgi:hypothetical protein
MPVTGPLTEPDNQGPVVLDAAAARDAIEEFEAGVARAMRASADEPADDRGGERHGQEGDNG